MNIDNNTSTVNKLKQDIKNIFNDFLNKGNVKKFCTDENKYILETNINEYLYNQFIKGNCADIIHCKVTYSSINPSDIIIYFYNSNNELIEKKYYW